mgnify:CR=1 FL=1
MFDEFTMLDPGPLAEYVGFTEQEVEELCGRYQMDLAEIKNWYDGYSFPGEKFGLQPAFGCQCHAIPENRQLLESDRNI